MHEVIWFIIAAESLPVHRCSSLLAIRERKSHCWLGMGIKMSLRPDGFHGVYGHAEPPCLLPLPQCWDSNVPWLCKHPSAGSCAWRSCNPSLQLVGMLLWILLLCCCWNAPHQPASGSCSSLDMMGYVIWSYLESDNALQGWGK